MQKAKTKTAEWKSAGEAERALNSNSEFFTVQKTLFFLILIACHFLIHFILFGAFRAGHISLGAFVWGFGAQKVQLIAPSAGESAQQIFAFSLSA